MKTAGLMMILAMGGMVWGAEVTNPDGTKRSSDSIDDLMKEKAKKETLPPNQRDPREVSKENSEKFPEEEQKKRQQELERSKMTVEQKARQRRMLDRRSVSDKAINSNLKERKSFPNRYGP
jgi:hypothetical protein